MKELIIATRNRHKILEIKALLQLPKITLLSPNDFPTAPEVKEDGTTFETNAEKKARTLSDFFKRWALADDSGLEVDALGGEPGIYSARYAGTHGDSEANNAKLLNMLVGEKNRKARFVCAMTLASPNGKRWTVRGTVEGSIIHEARGVYGFGYDPLFLPMGFKHTFAEMSDKEKNALSHRAKALKEIKGLLNAYC